MSNKPHTFMKTFLALSALSMHCLMSVIHLFEFLLWVTLQHCNVYFYGYSKKLNIPSNVTGLCQEIVIP